MAVDKLYGFLFGEFNRSFLVFFRIPNEKSIFMNSRSELEKLNGYFTWKDQVYQEFMRNILRSIEPKFDKKYTILVDELDDFDEVTFVQKGTIVIGYEINKLKTFCLKYKNCAIIGAYNVTFA